MRCANRKGAQKEVKDRIRREEMKKKMKRKEIRMEMGMTK
jgi:hypothetical protein